MYKMQTCGTVNSTTDDGSATGVGRGVEGRKAAGGQEATVARPPAPTSSSLLRLQQSSVTDGLHYAIMMHGRRLVSYRPTAVAPTDAADFQYQKLRYWIVQYRYQYRRHLRRYPGIRYTGIPVLEALIPAMAITGP